MPESKGTSWFKRIGNFMLVFSFASILWGGIVYMMEPRIEDYIMNVVDKNKGTSTRVDLANEMGVEIKDVCEEIGDMYKESMHHHNSQDSILTIWIPYLQEETKWTSVGYFVSIDDDEVVKFHHWDGRDYDAWKDDQGWFYVKGGFKYYN